MTIDLLALTARLIEVPSVSLDEAALADLVTAELAGIDGLDVERVGDNVVARTKLGREQRLIVAGHLDTVPPAGNERARLDGDTLWGLGAADMKGGLAVMLALAPLLSAAVVDVTLVFYVAEEIAAEHSGLAALLRDRPELVAGDAAILGEPTGAAIEAGCQGSMRLEVEVEGQRAHTARPWMGVNALHRLGEVLARAAAYEERQPVLDGCEFHEALQAVRVEGGVANNVVPDRAVLTLNHRFAPDRTAAEAEAHVRALLADVDGVTRIEVLEAAPAAPPGLAHPLLRALVDRGSLPVRAKLGWTDVARFAEAGIPALNFGPGDSALAHRADEHVTRAQLDAVYAALADLLTTP